MINRNLKAITPVFNNTRTVRGKHSISIVNHLNGKRMTIPHSLAEELGLEKTMAVMLDTERREILISKQFPFDGSATFNLSGDTKKIAYSSVLVKGVSESMKLDFSSSTSKTFADIAFETDEETGIKYAVVKIPKDTGVSEDEANNEDQQNKAV